MIEMDSRETIINNQRRESFNYYMECPPKSQQYFE